MEREIFRVFRQTLRRLGRRRSSHRQLYTDAAILEVEFWAVLCHRPVSWACVPEHWPPGLRRGPLPSQSVVSRRLRSESVCRLRKRVLDTLTRERATGLPPDPVVIIDGKAIPIPLHTADAQAGKGRSVGHTAAGYKLHAVIDRRGSLISWKLASLNTDEREMARRMVPRLPRHVKYLLGDSFYDSNPLHEVCTLHQIQLLAPRRTPGTGVGDRKQQPSRLLAIAALEKGKHPELKQMHRSRYVIEHFFARLTNAARGLTPPTWVRGYRRTHAWISTKLAIAHARFQINANAKNPQRAA